jgi:hypothetical protein
VLSVLLLGVGEILHGLRGIVAAMGLFAGHAVVSVLRRARYVSLTHGTLRKRQVFLQQALAKHPRDPHAPPSRLVVFNRRNASP